MGQGETESGPAYHYRCGELAIRAAVPFPELGAETSPEPGALRITMGGEEPAWPEPVEREWRMPDGSLWTTFQRAGADWVVRFPDYAAFRMAGDGSAVEVFARPGVSAGTLRHLLLNQIFPLALCARGRHTFHASAVAAEGRAAVFSGVSGAGKSTLALHFARNGNPFLSDDLVVFTPSPEGVRVHPSYPSLRVFSDSLVGAGGAGVTTIESAEYSEKSRVLGGADVAYQSEPAPLGAVYLIGAESERVEIAAVAGVDAVMELVRASFVLDAKRRDYLRSHLDWAGELAATGRLFRLAYPRDFARLEETRAAILAHLRSLD